MHSWRIHTWSADAGFGYPILSVECDLCPIGANFGRVYGGVILPRVYAEIADFLAEVELYPCKET